jgi:hypothetical protein
LLSCHRWNTFLYSTLSQKTVGRYWILFSHPRFMGQCTCLQKKLFLKFCFIKENVYIKSINIIRR